MNEANDTSGGIDKDLADKPDIGTVKDLADNAVTGSGKDVADRIAVGTVKDLADNAVTGSGKDVADRIAVGIVKDLAKGGDGVISHAGHSVFVPGVLPGERVEFVIRGQQKSVVSGSLIRILQPSPLRVEAPCSHYGECGGCDLQHCSPAGQLQLKEQILRRNLRTIARMDALPPLEVFASPPFRYRTKTVFQIRDGHLGFFRRRSRQLCVIHGCQLVPEAVETFLNENRDRFGKIVSGQLVTVSNGPELAAQLQTGRKAALVSAARTIEFRIGLFRYRVGPDNFIQSNRFLLPDMLRLLEESLAPLRVKRAVDLFCGAGFFSLVLAGRAAEVLALENDRSNLAAFRENLRLNRIGNVRPISADVGRTTVPEADFYVVDPPRAGIPTGIIDQLADGRPQALAYYSCDSATLARDLARLTRRNYRPRRMVMIDNFPQTDHFEVFTLLAYSP